MDRNGPAILEAGVTDIAGMATTDLGELAHHPLRVGVSLTDLEQDVLPRARGTEAEIFFDDEVFRLDSQRAASERRSVRTRRLERGR